MDKKQRRELQQRVRLIRRKRGLSQATLAKWCNVSTELVSRIERGVCLPSVPTLLAFARVLEVTPNELLGVADREDEAEHAKLVDAFKRLPPASRRELEHIAEALARFDHRR